MTTLVSIDPSISSAGVAIFVDSVLKHAFRVTRKVDTTKDLGARWRSMSRAILCDIAQQLGPYLVHVLVYERPQIYRNDRSPGDPNDLIGLTAIAAGVAAILHDAEVLTFTPAEWTGQVKKDKNKLAFESARGIRIMSRFTPEERKLVPEQHDIVDAAGIGLHALGRLGIRRSYSSE